MAPMMQGVPKARRVRHSVKTRLLFACCLPRVRESIMPCFFSSHLSHSHTLASPKP